MEEKIQLEQDITSEEKVDRTATIGEEEVITGNEINSSVDNNPMQKELPDNASSRLYRCYCLTFSKVPLDLNSLNAHACYVLVYGANISILVINTVDHKSHFPSLSLHNLIVLFYR